MTGLLIANLIVSSLVLTVLVAAGGWVAHTARRRKATVGKLADVLRVRAAARQEARP